jgi:hypothetical protein
MVGSSELLIDFALLLYISQYSVSKTTKCQNLTKLNKERGGKVNKVFFGGGLKLERRLVRPWGGCGEEFAQKCKNTL